MPHPRGRKQSTRRRILRAAAVLFRAKGYDATTIAEIMRACSLTHGGFYSHFGSKAHLYREAVTNASAFYSPQASPPPATGGGGIMQNAPAVDDDRLTALLASCDPSSDAASRGAWMFLARDIANSSPEVRKSYAEALHCVRDMLEGRLSDRSSQRHDLAATAMLIGALAISQTIDDAGFKAAIVDACRSAVQSLGGDEPLSFFWMPEAAETAQRRLQH